MPTLFKNPRTKLAAAMTSAALIGAGGVAVVYAAFGDGGTTVVRQVTVNSAEPTANSTTSSINDIYKNSYKSVVEITVSSAANSSEFGGNGGTQQAQGSGFVYDDQGHVITNQHVVDGASRSRCTLWNGKTYDATVVGTDASTDIAVLHVDAPASVLAPALARRLLQARRSVTAWSRSAARSVSRRRSRAGSSAPSTARSPRRTTSRSTTRSRRTPRSTTATPAARCST